MLFYAVSTFVDLFRKMFADAAANSQILKVLLDSQEKEEWNKKNIQTLNGRSEVYES